MKIKKSVYLFTGLSVLVLCRTVQGAEESLSVLDQNTPTLSREQDETLLGFLKTTYEAAELGDPEAIKKTIGFADLKLEENNLPNDLLKLHDLSRQQDAAKSVLRGIRDPLVYQWMAQKGEYYWLLMHVNIATLKEAFGESAKTIFTNENINNQLSLYSWELSEGQKSKLIELQK